MAVTCTEVLLPKVEMVKMMAIEWEVQYESVNSNHLLWIESVCYVYLLCDIMTN